MQLLTIRQSAERCAISTRALYKMISCGRFGPELVRLGRSVRVREPELATWIQAGCPSRAEFQMAPTEKGGQTE